VVDDLLRDQRVLETLLNEQEKILAIHITDRKIYNNYELTVKF
jgi:hypothetical protein